MHTPWQVLEHMRLAQWDILEFSRDPNHISPDFPKGYWPPTEAPPGANAWNKCVASFRADLEAMAALVEDPATDLFARIPHGDGQTVLREAMLIADHNAYHLGRICPAAAVIGRVGLVLLRGGIPMSGHLCPWWMAYTFDNPLRRISARSSDSCWDPYVREGMTVVDVGCGMGHFSIGMARLVGETGVVISVDLQQEMLEILNKRATKAGVAGRIRLHQVRAGTVSHWMRMR